VSAAGRNLKGNERRADDFYATPAWCTNTIARYLQRGNDLVSVLDPCCGDGAILDVLEIAWNTRERLGIEIDAQRAFHSGRRHNVLHADALEKTWPEADLLVTNPPYSLAMEFIAKAIDWIGSTGREAAFLTRLNFLGSQKRATFHRRHPCDIHVLPKRPSFTNGGTDATEYCWMVWGPNRGNRWFMLKVT
jgi:hypothetical protein